MLNLCYMTLPQKFFSLQLNTIIEGIDKKLVAVGDVGCGKTSLLNVFTTNEAIDENVSQTLVNESIEAEVDGLVIELSLCSTAG